MEWTAIVLLMYMCPEFGISGHEVQNVFCTCWLYRLKSLNKSRKLILMVYCNLNLDL